MPTKTPQKKRPADVVQFEATKLDQFHEGLTTAVALVESLRELLPTLSPDGLARASQSLSMVDRAISGRDGVQADLKDRLLTETMKHGTTLEDQGKPKHVYLTPNYRLTQVETSRRTLVPEKLIEVGVTPRQLDHATKVTESVYVRITRRRFGADA